MLNRNSDLLRDRVITMMTGLFHFRTINLNDLCDGLDYDRGNLADRESFGRFMSTAVELEWVEVNWDNFSVSLTTKGAEIAQSMERVCDVLGVTPIEQIAREVAEDARVDAPWDNSSWDDTPSWDDSPEYPEDW